MEPVSYHPLFDKGVYDLSELRDMTRFSSIEVVVSDYYVGACRQVGDLKFYMPIEDNLYKLVGYVTYYREEDDKYELGLIVCHGLERPEQYDGKLFAMCNQ